MNKTVISKAKSSAATLKRKALAAIKKVRKISKIKSQADFDKVGVLLKAAKEIKKEADVELNELLIDTKETEAKIRSAFKPILESVGSVEAEYKEKMLAFMESLENSKEKLNADFTSGKVKSIKSYNGKLDKLTIGHVKGGASIRKGTQLKIYDESLIPRKFLVPDEVAIRKALLEGEEIPGCKMVEVKGISI